MSKKTIMIWPDGQWLEESEYDADFHKYLGINYLKQRVDTKMTDEDICAFVDEYCADIFIND